VHDRASRLNGAAPAIDSAQRLSDCIAKANGDVAKIQACRAP
jgi:hypothetical protein